MHQVATIEKRNNLDAGRQDSFVQLLLLGFDRLKRGLGFGAFAQEHDALDDVVIVENFAIGAVDGFSDLAQTDSLALHDGGDIRNPEWCSVLRFEYGLTDVVDVAEESEGANVDLLQPGFDEAADGVDVVHLQGLLHLSEREAVGNEFVRIDADLIFARGSAEADDVDDIWNGFELLFERPVLESFELHQIVFRIGAMQRVPINLADRAVIAADLRLEIIGERKLREALENFLAVPIVGGLIVEDQHQAGESEERGGAQMFEMRDAVHHDLDGNSDLLFHFFSGASGPLGDDLDVIVGDVGVGFDRQIVKRSCAPNEQ